MNKFSLEAADIMFAAKKAWVLEPKKVLNETGPITSSMASFDSLVPSVVIREGRSLTAVGARVGIVTYLPQ
jgi:hypothetical protein